MIESSQSDIYDPAFVKSVFDRCSRTYILFSTVLSFGFTEIWRRQCARSLPQPDTDDRVCYDLMSGTGEVWPHLLDVHPNTRRIKSVDISDGMYRHALKRLHRMRAHKIEFERADILSTDLEPDCADMVISTFGLKTFNRDQQAQFASLVARILKPGGTFSMIEASDPRGWIFRPIYNFHLRRVLPLIERLFLRGATDFKMIGIYSRNFGSAQNFADDLQQAGLDVTFAKRFFGFATAVYGRKPS